MCKAPHKLQSWFYPSLSHFPLPHHPQADLRINAFTDVTVSLAGDAASRLNESALIGKTEETAENGGELAGCENVYCVKAAMM